MRYLTVSLLYKIWLRKNRNISIMHNILHSWYQYSLRLKHIQLIFKSLLMHLCYSIEKQEFNQQYCWEFLNYAHSLDFHYSFISILTRTYDIMLLMMTYELFNFNWIWCTKHQIFTFLNDRLMGCRNVHIV